MRGLLLALSSIALLGAPGVAQGSGVGRAVPLALRLGVAQFWASNIGEIIGMVSNRPYYLPLTQHDNLDDDPDDAFTTMGCQGSVVGLRTSSQGKDNNPLDSGENMNVTLRKCTGFASDGACTWSPTDFAVSVVGDGATTTWTDTTGATAFGPGDMLTIELVCPSPCNQPDTVEWPVYVVETRCNDPETSVLGASFPAHKAGQNRAFPVTGWSNALMSTTGYNEGRSRCPVPGDFSVAGLTVSTENDDVAITYSLCRSDGSSGDENCGGTNQGEELMAVTWSAGEGVREKSSTSCLASDCDLVAGDVVFLRASAAPSPSAGVGVGIALTSSTQKWMSGLAGLVLRSHVYEATMSGSTAITPCAVPGGAKCQADLISGATATAFYSRIHTALEGATWFAEVLDGLAGTDLEVTHDDTGGPVPQIKSDTGTASIAAGDTFLIQQTSMGVTDTIGYCQTLLWDDLQGPETSACSDGADQDGDSLADFPADPGCADVNDDSEHSPALVCDNGLDDDANGVADFPADGGCTGPTDPTETNAPASDVDWSMNFEGPGCVDGATDDTCIATVGANADCGAGTSHCPMSGLQSGRSSGQNGTFLAFQSVAAVTPSHAGGALTCRLALNVDVATTSQFTLWQATFGGTTTPVRVLMRRSGATLQLLGRTGGTAATGWVDTGFAPDQDWALQIRYRPHVDVVELWWGSDFAVFGTTPNASADGASPASVDGQALVGGAGWQYVVDDWACDASPE